MKEYFKVCVSKYVSEKDFEVVRPASLNNPKDNAVMFIITNRMDEVSAFNKCRNCLIFWPKDVQILDECKIRHAVYVCEDPHKEYCRFFFDNKITYPPAVEMFEMVNGAYICKNAKIGENCHIFLEHILVET